VLPHPPTLEVARASRAGGKLAAGMVHFGLSEAVRGAQVVDIGASTGGFTEVLLEHGAARVTAVDVGQGQLHARLRGDARVESHEQTDWKTLSLNRLPGPFDFFTIDVSFVAARSMLRGLAFRLRPGAQGLVLVKPQFELARRPLEQLARPEVRARALTVFRKKAKGLGFEVAGVIDSPVAGRSGTVEMLVHLRFRERPATLPAWEDGSASKRTGDARAAAPVGRTGARRARAANVALPAEVRWFAVVAPGLEEVARAEVERLPAVRAVEQVAGGIEFSGSLAVGMAANLQLRVATRVLARVGTVRAREFSKLRRLLGKLRFEPFVPAELPLRVAASATRSRLYHTGAIAETACLGIGDRLGAKLELVTGGEGAEAADGAQGGEAAVAVSRVLVRGEGDQWTVSVDASGELLHRRGWRLAAGRAPLRETLAAGVLALAGYEPERPLVDAMCGAGTLAIEAAGIAAGRAPGLGRAFSFERWPGFDRALWERLRSEAERGQRPPPAPILGWDRDAAVLERARQNADRAGFSQAIAFAPTALAQWRLPDGLPAGLVVINPPYGRRLASPAAARQLVRQIGDALRAHFQGWRAAVLLGDFGWSRMLGMPISAQHRLINGGLRVFLVVTEVPGGAE
jgi:putative N6-adenine-specific DNA methylase